MQLTTTSNKLTEIKTDCLIIGVYDNQLNKLSKLLPATSIKALEAAYQNGYMQKPGHCILTQCDTLQAKNVLLVELGKQTDISVKQWRAILSSVFSSLNQPAIKDAVFAIGHLHVKDHDSAWIARDIVIQAQQTTYQFTAFKSSKSKTCLKKLSIACSTTKAHKQAIKQGQAIASGMALCRDLGNTPPNICNAGFLLKHAKQLAKTHARISLKTVEEKDMRQLGMGAILSVSQGSDNPARLIIMQYKGADKKQAPIALIGKGITFDNGGNNIKSAAGMVGMKFDMCGAATLFGVIQACAELKLPINVTAVASVAENMINGEASRPSDIIKTMSGQTVEILNTDAEGRLVLCDAMTYAQRQLKPSKMISMATLTGAAVMTFGNVHSALLANNQALANALLDAGTKAEDRAWQLPLGEEYHDLLRSEFADFSNAVLSRQAGTITSACFLEKFVENTPWAHLDIAGSATEDAKNVKASGRPVGMLMQYLLDI